jgi:predicted hotdog family 3-hydroxylacyl-ACP dehydratase
MSVDADLAPDGRLPHAAHPMDAWLPHRGRMRLVDGVDACDAAGIVATMRVAAGGLFVGAQGMPAWIGLEAMAQAAAAWSGWQARGAGGAPRVGFLVGVRRYEARVASFAVGAALRIAASCALAGDNGLRVFDCRIEHDGQVLATGRISVYESDRPGVDGSGAPTNPSPRSA